MKNDFLIDKDLEVFVSESNYSLGDIAEETKVSLRTLNNILSNKTSTSNDVLDKIYSFAYEKGYRFNKVKEELFKEINKDIILFHGATHVIEELRKDGSRDNCDFGKGFYLGETYFQASSFVYEQANSSVYVFSINTDDLKIVELDCNIDWMLTVCYFRKMINDYCNHPLIINLLNKIKNADIIIAPIADNKMFNIMREFGDGQITTKQAIHSLASSGLGKQYVLKTDKAIAKLVQIDRLFISSAERKAIKNSMEERGKEIDTKLKLSKREFRGEGQYIDELFK